MKKIDVNYERIYTDDVGKHTRNLFGKDLPETIAYKRLWGNIVDGFFACTNSDILIAAAEGSIRIVVVADDHNNKFKFEQYYLTGMDGKTITIPEGTKYAIQNMESTTSSFFVGSFEVESKFEYSTSRIFNWRSRRP